MFERCPRCGRQFILRPKVCECGYDFAGGGLKLLCPLDKTELKEEWVECPKCRKPINDLFRYPCPKCGEIVGFKEKYCSKCGEQLVREFFICWNCKREVEVGSAVCPKCGIKFYKGYAKCPRCGGLVEDDAVICPHCGLRFAEEGGGTAEYVCSRCGTGLPYATAPCPVCESRYSYESEC